MLLSFSKKSDLLKTDKARYFLLKEHCRRRQIPIKDFDLFDLALTHISFGASNPNESYERLEFLGDSVIGLCLAGILYQHYPDLSEGRMSALKSTLADEKSLAQAARELELLPLVRLGRGEKLQDKRAQQKVLCDIFESMMAVMLMDYGYDRCREFALKLFSDKIGHIQASGVPDFKTRLQKISVKAYKSYPIYTVLHTEGPDHGKIFNVKCSLERFEASAKGRSKKEAEQECAKAVLEAIKEYAVLYPEAAVSKEYLNEKMKG